jgi:hypothetical protein
LENNRFQFNKLEEIIEPLLKDYPHLRDSDNLLWLTILNITCNLREKINNSVNPYFTLIDIIKTQYSIKSVARVRAKIQAEGKYLGSKKIQQYRKDTEDEFKNYFKN